MTTPTLLLIDGHSLAYRAYFSFPANLTFEGKPINAVFGFASMLMSVIEKCKPTHLAVCFDRKEPTFRHDFYEAYKGHRAPAPDDFVVQMPILEAIVSRLGVCRLDHVGYEADDLLGTLSRMADEQEMKTLILTGDRDSFQLVSAHVHVLMNRRGVSELDLFDPEAVKEKYQLVPEQLIDLKALQGDASDNIPGVKGIGEKSASKLMIQYGSLDAVYANIDDVKPDRVRNALMAGKESADISRRLALIDRYVPVTVSIDDLKFSADWDAVVQCFDAFEFKALASRYRSKSTGSVAPEPVASVAAPDGTTVLIDTETGLKEILAGLKDGFAVDLETTSLQVHDAQIVGVALSAKPGHAVYVAMNPYVIAVQPQMDLFGTRVEVAPFVLNPLLAALKPMLEDRSIPKWTHNGKYEIEVFANYGIELRGIAGDSMLAGFLLDPLQRVGLKEMVRQHFSVEMTPFTELIGSGKTKRTLIDVPASEVAAYAGADADYTLRLIQKLDPEMETSTAAVLYHDIELPLQRVLADMERTGVAIDLPYLSTLKDQYRARLTILEAQIHEAAGIVFNVNSTQQLAGVLFDRLNLPVFKKTKTGRSTDSEVLDSLVDVHPIATVLLEYRKLEKLMNTYVESLPLLVNPRTGKVHTSFNQTGAVTGRMSSTNPNLQNIPIRDPDGIAIRRAFVSSLPGGKIVSADYSQIELRLMAYLSQDPAMIDAFLAGVDIHKTTAAKIFGVSVESVTKSQRYQAKAVNFGIIYGISAFGLARNIGVSRGEAKAIIDGYFEVFPQVKRFMEQTIVDAKDKGCVWTEFGRVRPLPELLDRNPGRKQFGERTAINTRLQGTAADLIKLAMVRIYDRLAGLNFKSKMIIQVHDELVFDADPTEVDALATLVKSEMETAWVISIPLRAYVAIGDNWEEA